MLGRRLNEFRNEFRMPEGTSFPNLAPGVDLHSLKEGENELTYGNPTLAWFEVCGS